jgi:hypothetical protein
VLLPFYNPGPYFVPAVKSVLNQTFGDFELLLLDDGSTDGSERDAAEFTRADRRAIAIRTERNVGLSAQLNVGIRRARGRYLARMDADDLAETRRFEKQVQVLERDPRIGICGSIVQEFNDNGMGALWVLPESPDDVHCLMFLRSCFNHPSVMIRAGVLADHGLLYDESFVVAQDYELWHRLLKLTRGFNIQEPLMKYRRLPSQLSQAASPRKQQEGAAVRRQIRLDLGLPESETVAALHSVIAGDFWPDSSEWFAHAVSWLNTAYQANQQERVFPVNAFGRMLADKLFLHCSMASRRGLNGWQLYRRAEFANARRQSSLTTIKMIAKALVKPRVA